MIALLESEKTRLKFRHFWLIPGLFLFLLYTFVLPGVFWGIFTLLKHHCSDTSLCVISIILSHHISFLFHTSILYIIRLLEIPWLEQYRLNSTWPADMLPRSIKTLSLNYLIMIPLAEFTFAATGSIESRLDPIQPHPSEVFKHLMVSIIAEDIASYFTHWLIHKPLLYSMVHKQHHEFKTTVSYAAEYAGVLEYLFVNIMATGTGPMILGANMHINTLMVFVCYRVGITCDRHCGYDFPWSPWSVLPFSTSAEHHNTHHTKNMGNLGSQFVILDYLLGTNFKKTQKIVSKIA